MSDILVSIVIPVYRAEKQLRRCLDSVLAQDHRPLQAIVVNDGSPDGCPEIIDEYAERYPEVFTALHQENAGQGPARDAGIAEVRGAYLCMVDADDYLESDYVSTMLDLAVSEKADVVMSSFFYEYEKSGRRATYPFMFNRSLSGRKAARKTINMLTLPSFIWNKMYRADLWKKDKPNFPELYYEDMAVMPGILHQVDKVVTCSRPLYHYMQHAESSVGTFKEKNLSDFLEVSGIVADFLQDEGYYPAWRGAWRTFLFNARFYLYGNILFRQGKADFSKRRRQLKHAGKRLRSLNRRLKLEERAQRRRSGKAEFCPDESE